jgi:predicted dehydrogenase
MDTGYNPEVFEKLLFLMEGKRKLLINFTTHDYVRDLTMSKIINWGIIGCGDVTEKKSGPAFNKVKGSSLLAVMRRDGEKAKDYARRHNVPYWYDNADELIRNPKVDAVYIATPPGSHSEYAIQAMKAGKPVYVEKPMAAHYSECLEMIKISEQTGQPLFVAYYRRLLPGFMKVKELIDNGYIGNPLYFTIHYFAPHQPADYQQPLPWRVSPELSGGGYIYDLGSHQLDLIDYLLGPIEKVSALAFNQHNLYPVEDFVSAAFKGQNKIAGNAVWSFGAPAHMKTDMIEIAGTRGKVNFSCFGFTDTVLCVDGINSYYGNPRPEHVQLNLIQSIVNEMNGKGKCPSTAYTAARTSRLLDLITSKQA